MDVLLPEFPFSISLNYLNHFDFLVLYRWFKCESRTGTNSQTQCAPISNVIRFHATHSALGISNVLIRLLSKMMSQHFKSLVIPFLETVEITSYHNRFVKCIVYICTSRSRGKIAILINRLQGVILVCLFHGSYESCFSSFPAVWNLHYINCLSLKTIL